MNTKIKENIKAVILGLILTTGISFTLAADVWTPPDCSPPNCNASAPINVSPSSQVKVGKFGIGLADTDANRTTITNTDAVLQTYGKFLANSGALIRGDLIIDNGTQANGRFLKSDADGKATWSDISGGGAVQVRTTKLGRITTWWVAIDSLGEQPIGIYLRDRPGTFFSDNPTTLNHLCSIMFPNVAPYILSYQQMQWTSPTDNYTVYWNPTSSKFISSRSSNPDPVTSSITLNSGINSNAPFTCTSVQTQFTL